MYTLARPASTPHWLAEASSSLPRKIAFAVLATVLVACAAHVSVPLPFSPVPLTLQPFAVLLVGLLLGPATAFATMLLYLGEGAMGLPVFSPLGPGGVAQLMGPTGGYLLSYPLVAAAAGWLVTHLRFVRSALGRGLIASLAATVILFTFGATWLAMLLHLPLRTALHLAVLPFVPGEVVKIVAAAMLYRALAPAPQHN